MKTSVFAPANAYEFIVSVDANDPQMAGTIYHRSLLQGLPFGGVPSLALAVEDVLDSQEGGAPVDPFERGAYSNAQAGQVATFRLDVLFRQHNSWQGRVTWLEEGIETKFRSFLGLVFILNDILADETA